jgi:hypothetical protein
MRNFEGIFGDFEFPACILAIGICIALIIAATSLHKESGSQEINQFKERIGKLEQSLQELSRLQNETD